MDNLTLYELADARDIIDLWLDEHEGEETPELAELLANLEGSTTDKVERVALYILELEANAIACREEAKRLTARAAAKGARADHLRAYLTRQLERLGKKSVDGDRVKVTRQNNSAVSIRCEDLSEAYRTQGGVAAAEAGLISAAVTCETKEVTTYLLNRTELTRRFHAGEIMPDGVTVTQGQHVRIR